MEFLGLFILGEFFILRLLCWRSYMEAFWLEVLVEFGFLVILLGYRVYEWSYF